MSNFVDDIWKEVMEKKPERPKPELIEESEDASSDDWMDGLEKADTSEM